MAEQLLDVPQGCAAAQHMRGEAVAQDVRGDVRLDTGTLGVVLQNEPEALTGEALARAG